MKDQINTIREALAIGSDAAYDLGKKAEAEQIDKALTAFDQIEAMAWEPVAWMVTTELQDGTRSTYPLSGRYKDVRDACDFGEPVPLFAAPVAQQPQAEPTCNPHPKAPHGFNRNASHTEDRYVCDCEGWDAWDAGYSAGWRAGFDAPQQAEAVPLLTNAFLADVMTAAGLVSHGKQCKALGERLGAEVARLRTAAPQQAEAVPSDHPLYVFATEVIHGAYRYTELPAKAKAAIAAAQGAKT